MQHNRLERAVARAGGNSRNCVDDLLAGGIRNLTENGVLALQPRRRVGRDEELRTVRSLDLAGNAVAAQTSVCHRELVGGVEVKLGADLIVEVVAGAANALSERVATLNHEVRDDAVKNDVFVQGAFAGLSGCRVRPRFAAVGETNEVRDGFGCLVAEEVHDNVAVVGVQSCGVAVKSHSTYSLLSGKMKQHHQNMEEPMALDRKQKKQLARLQADAQDLWEQQQAVYTNAGAVAREAAHQLGQYNRTQVVPAVQQVYAERVQPTVDRSVQSAQKINSKYVTPAVGTVVGSAMAAWDAANKKRAEYQHRGGTFFAAPAPVVIEAPKKSSGAGGVFAMILALGAAAAVLYAAFKAYTADDELWVADEPLAE